jgi:hypothetical protein
MIDYSDSGDQRVIENICVFCRLSDGDPLDLVERNLVLSAVIKLGCPRRFVVSDLLGHFQLAAVLQIRRDAGRAEGMIANPRFDVGDNSQSGLGLLGRGMV